MKNFILFFLLFAATVTVSPDVYAAFPVNTNEGTAMTLTTDNSIVTAQPDFAMAAPAAPTPKAPAMGGGPGLSIAALVLGIVAVLTSAWTLAIIAGALAIIFGALNLRGPKPGMALAGLILGIVGVALALIHPWDI